MENKKIIIGSDHAGYHLKSKIINYLQGEGYEVFDNGVHSTNSVDYPIIARDTAKKVANGEFEKGIIICGSGIGVSIVANKVKGIRAVVCSDTTSARFSRLHNDCNILCFGERIVGEYLAKDICKIWLETEFEAERHLKRVNMIDPQ